MAFEEQHAEKPPTATAAGDRPEQVVGGLLRLAGRRVPPPDERARRVHAAVHAQWRRTVRARRLRRAALWTGLATAAAGAAWLTLALPGSLPAQAPGAAPPDGAPAAPAKVERLTGDVRLVSAAQGVPSLGAGDTIPAGAVLESGSAGRAALRLHGGGSLRIDVDTRLRLVSAVQISLEQGALYLDSDPGRGTAAVTVHTRFGQVRELGTQFEVRLGPETLRVRVREGRIGLDHGAGAAEGLPGNELSLQDGKVSRRAVSRHGPQWSWVQQIAPAFELDGESLGRFLAWVSRETGRPVRIAGDAAHEGGPLIRLHGSIEGLSPEEALSTVLPTCGLTHWYSRGAIQVGRRAPGQTRAGDLP